MKTIITASVSTKTALRLQQINKGNRSRVIDRAITEYLDGKAKFNINDVETKVLASVLQGRIKNENGWQDTPLTLLLVDLVNDLS